MHRNALFIALAVAALAAPAAHAGKTAQIDPDSRFHSPAVSESLKAGKLAAARAEFEARKGKVSTAAVTREEVGDADSFGRNVKWLGLVAGSIQLSTDCTPPPGSPPNPNCVTVAPSPALTTFDVPDIASITLPGKSSNSLLCHWQTPILFYFGSNNTGAPQTLQINVSPTYRIQSEVLDDPGLINPGTGLPYGGEIQTRLLAVIKSHTIGPGEFESEYDSGTRMCIASIISKHALINQYGLSPAQANQFFKKPITITMGISGQTRMIESASVYFGTRFVGD